MKDPRGRSPRLLDSRLRTGGGAPESAARKRGAGARQVSSRELVHGGSEAARGGDRPLRRALGTEGAFSLTGRGDEHLGKSTGAADSVLPSLCPALKGLEKAKVVGARGSRGTRAGVCGGECWGSWGGAGGSSGCGVHLRGCHSTGLRLRFASSGRLRPRPPPIAFCFCAFCREEPFLLAWKPWCSRSEKVGQYWWGSDSSVCPQPKAAKAATTTGTWSALQSGPGCRGLFELFPTLTLPRKI